jgi:hypothetical protein
MRGPPKVAYWLSCVFDRRPKIMRRHAQLSEVRALKHKEI